MTASRQHLELADILHELRSFPNETSWVEFKHNNADPEEIGEYISALSNSAALERKIQGWLVWGVDDGTHEVQGTTFRPEAAKVGNEELESWLLRLLSPKILFHFHSLMVADNPVVMLEIYAASQHPVRFKSTEYIRIGSYKKPLKDFPEKERALWRIFEQKHFEREIALESVGSEEVVAKLNYPAYFDALDIPLPTDRKGILHALHADGMIVPVAGKWNVTNLGAVLFSKQLSDFRTVGYKTIRVIQYKGNAKYETLREQEWRKGYACGFNDLIALVANFVPSHETIEGGIRRDVAMFPMLAVRELVANAIVHQDFHIGGTAPMVEIFANRMEITNPGLPLVDTERFLDSPPKSRNEAVVSFMRRIGVCEERGSGIDKVIRCCEESRLPAPLFETTAEHTRAVLFAYRPLPEMEKGDRIRACYQHACLKFVHREFMTNASLRDRFGLSEDNRPAVSRIISETIAAGYIKIYDETVGSRARKYVPVWA